MLRFLNCFNKIFLSTESEDCCWGIVDSSTEKLFQVPGLHSISPPPPPEESNNSKIEENVQVIPMKEELEVRLEEGTFPVILNSWPEVNMDQEVVTAPLRKQRTENSTKETPTIQANRFAGVGGNQVKLELEVTLTPEIPRSDTIITSTINTNSCGTSLSVTPSISKTLTTVIPPTTIVCLPSAVNTAPMLHSTVNEVTQCASIPRTGMVQSSSALPYLALSTSQPIRAVSTHSKSKPKSQHGGSSRNRGSNKPPPGAVNLERSYQICQAVIQNSPNRDQLRGQLKPPPSLLAAAHANSNKKNETFR